VSFGLATLGPMARHLGMLALRMGDLKRAEQHLERAIAAAERMSSPTFVALACLAYVRVLLLGNESGARERATQILARAFDLAREFGMHAAEHECRRIAERGALSLAHPRVGQAAIAIGPQRSE
jgi:hypothetical protein